MVARIRDRKLGLCRLFFSLCIFTYIGILNIGFSKGYAKQGTLRGNSRLSFRAPTVDNCDPGDATCVYAFTPPQHRPYCSQSALPYEGRKLFCSELPANMITAGLGSGNQFFLASRHQITVTNLTNDQNVFQSTLLPEYCRQQKDDSDLCEEYVYSSDVLKFTALFDHGFESSGIDIRGTSQTMNGTIISRNKKLCDGVDTPAKEWDEGQGLCEISPNKTTACLDLVQKDLDTGSECGYDIFTVGALLNTMGPKLPQLDSVASTHGKSKTYRDQGMLMNIVVTYTNENAFDLATHPTYTIEIKTVPHQSAKWDTSSTAFISSTAKSLESIASALPIDVTTSSAGLKINVIFIDRRVLKIDAATLLSSLTSALTLIALASMIVDFCMLSRLSQLRQYYRQLKFTSSIDFSDLKESLHNNNNDTVNPTLDIRALVEGPTSKGGTCNTRKKKNAQVEDGKKQEMIELYRWKRKSNGGKEFVQISIPADLLKSVPNS